jgi:hypothetical protein
MTDFDVALCFVFLQFAVCIEEEDSIVLDIMFAFVIPKASHRKLLLLACPVIVNERLNLFRCQHGSRPLSFVVQERGTAHLPSPVLFNLVYQIVNQSP